MALKQILRYLRHREDQLLELREEVKKGCESLELIIEFYFEDPETRHVQPAELEALFAAHERHQDRVSGWLDINARWISLSTDIIAFITVFPDLSG